ncbi:MAG: ATP-binding protein [Planctomycetota bacterium]
MMTLAELIGKIRLAPHHSPEAVRRREREDRADDVRDGWLEDARWLPRAPYARLTNPGWLRVADPRIVAAVKVWNPRLQGLALFGPTGTGKTSGVLAGLRGAMAASRADILAGREHRLPRFAWVKEVDLLKLEKQHPLGRGASPRLRLLHRVRHLIVDEVGPGHGHPKALFELIDQRYDNGQLPTTITCGHTPDVLVSRYGDALYRRLSHMADELDLFTTEGEP